MTRQKALQLARKRANMGYGFTKKLPYISYGHMEYKICADKLPTAATVHFL